MRKNAFVAGALPWTPLRELTVFHTFLWGGLEHGRKVEENEGKRRGGNGRDLKVPQDKILAMPMLVCKMYMIMFMQFMQRKLFSFYMIDVRVTLWLEEKKL